MTKITCSSCGTDISTVSNSVSFSCPNCGKATIVRCGKCRKLVVKYKCSSCGFEGP
ncbi:MAG: zinc finger domain-containing protein [Candidatus Nanoarchaeia archaeon]|nr:zinc finger domain-containing protein [Candidatus Haiyanarchaeum thermophilum]MCW1303445.1 zinc finger domain-containing protein [Candidatus Haiyanarchaeum thermophilum]MCW1306853.1 zinc finger domain-containing protein [Candidatus Haiyanarchaeum thermophilum]MCW1308275.1 zinc finger domain-containing protein [Candidatus Haiyanarchaeum thermophilum]MCW1308625.1 zinc finger domain-containing protein [Candidatus Haiyanarchaeum thermophilum]